MDERPQLSGLIRFLILPTFAEDLFSRNRSYRSITPETEVGVMRRGFLKLVPIGNTTNDSEPRVEFWIR
jgi:hypothetical protein